MIKLFPNITGWPTGIRRATMVVVWPLVLVEALLNCLVRFPREFYICWNVERYRNGQ